MSAYRLTQNVVDPVRELILPRLEGVRQAGSGWTARCPAHKDRSASLSLGVGREGQALVHCFAACDVADVLGAIGLTVADLYPRQPRDMGPLARAERRQAIQAAATLAAAKQLALDAALVEIAAGMVEVGHRFTDDDHQLLVAARLRCEATALHLRGVS